MKHCCIYICKLLILNVKNIFGLNHILVLHLHIPFTHHHAVALHYEFTEWGKDLTRGCQCSHKAHKENIISKRTCTHSAVSDVISLKSAILFFTDIYVTFQYSRESL